MGLYRALASNDVQQAVRMGLTGPASGRVQPVPLMSFVNYRLTKPINVTQSAQHLEDYKHKLYVVFTALFSLAGEVRAGGSQ